MKIVCAPESYQFAQHESGLEVVLYGSTSDPKRGAIGGAIPATIRRARLVPAPIAWDLVSLALSVFAADLAGHRAMSPDGWTRSFDLHIAVSDPDRWSQNKGTVESLLCYLTTDVWEVSFVGGGLVPEAHPKAAPLDVDAAILLSGGLDSLVGAIDRGGDGKKLIAVSQTVRGDVERQERFAAAIGAIRSHLRLSHTEHIPNGESPASQRSRSLIFLAYGVLAATATLSHLDGGTVNLFVCENGLIALNPPLTPARVGSLSTRTMHPVVLAHFQALLSNLGLRVNVSNPYCIKTKGEMLVECRDQSLLQKLATQSTSCSRFKQYGYKHCGRCVPCLVRRAAFEKWRGSDKTVYRFNDLGRDDADYARFDDVRSTMMAISESKRLGVRRWMRATLSSNLISGKSALSDVVRRGLEELEVLMVKLKVQ